MLLRYRTRPIEYGRKAGRTYLSCEGVDLLQEFQSEVLQVLITIGQLPHLPGHGRRMDQRGSWQDQGLQEGPTIELFDGSRTMNCTRNHKQRIAIDRCWELYLAIVHLTFMPSAAFLLVMLGLLASRVLLGGSALAAMPICVAIAAYCSTLVVASYSAAAGLTFTQKRIEPQPCRTSLKRWVICRARRSA